MREVVTVQLGRRANYLCTHFWNTQESYQTFAPDPPSLVNHDIHFRQGLGPDGAETFLPRALIYDFKAQFGTLARVNALATLMNEETDALWNGPTTRLTPVPQNQPSPYANSLLNATETVLPTPATTPFFADFASTYYHPRSLLPLSLPPSASQLSDSTNSIPTSGSRYSSQFSAFESGVDLFAARDAEVDILDEDIRLWIEECDELQAIQVFTSSDDAWSGFSSRYVERLRDELGKCCIWVWGIDNSADESFYGAHGKMSRTQKQESVTNSALAVSRLSEQASLLVPLALPKRLPSDIKLDRRVLWHTSGLLSAAMESVTISTRIKEGERVPTVQDWQDVLSGGGRRRIAALAFDSDCSLEDRSAEVQDTRMQNSDVLEDEETDIMKNLRVNLFPETNARLPARLPARNKVFARIEGFRSVVDKQGELFLVGDKLPSREGPLLERYFTPVNYPLRPTFPSIFTTDHPRPDEIPLRTSLTTSASISTWIRSIQASLKASFGEGLAGEEREHLINDLGQIAETYIEDWESADDSGYEE